MSREAPSTLRARNVNFTTRFENVNIVKKVINGDSISAQRFIIIDRNVFPFSLEGAGASLYSMRNLNFAASGRRIFCQVKIYENRIKIGMREFNNVLSVKRCNIKYVLGPRETGQKVNGLVVSETILTYRNVLSLHCHP